MNFFRNVEAQLHRAALVTDHVNKSYHLIKGDMMCDGTLEYVCLILKGLINIYFAASEKYVKFIFCCFRKKM
jgi:hypothetical protein